MALSNEEKQVNNQRTLGKIVTLDAKAVEAFDKSRLDRGVADKTFGSGFAIEFDNKADLSTAEDVIRLSVSALYGDAILSRDDNKIARTIDDLSNVSFGYCQFEQNSKVRETLIVVGKKEVGESERKRVANMIIYKSNEIANIYSGPKMPTFS